MERATGETHPEDPNSEGARPEDAQPDRPQPDGPRSAGAEAADQESTEPGDAAAANRPVVYWETPAPEIGPGGAGWRGVGSVVGRTLDTYGTALGAFLALSIPTAILGAMSVFAGTNVAAIILIAVVTAVVSLVTGAAMMLATDDLWRGVRPGLADVLDRAAGRIGALIGSGLVVVLVFAGFVIVLLIIGAIVGVSAAVGSSTGPGIVVFTMVALVLFIAGTILALRWSLAAAAIVLDSRGPLAGLNRSRALTRGKVWRLVGLYVVLGLIAALASVGVSLLSTYAERVLAAVGLAIATVVSGPLLSIAPAIVYRDLSGRTEQLADVVPRTTGRQGSLLAVVGGGIILCAAGIWAVAGAGGQIFIPDRGQVVAGTSSNAADPCRPGGVKSTFTSAEEIWIAAVFASHVPAGEEIVVDYSRDAESLGSAPLTAGPTGLDCYYEIDPIRGGAPGTYRIIVRHGSAVIAEGGFTIR